MRDGHSDETQSPTITLPKNKPEKGDIEQINISQGLIFRGLWYLKNGIVRCFMLERSLH